MRNENKKKEAKQKQEKAEAVKRDKDAKAAAQAIAKQLNLSGTPAMVASGATTPGGTWKKKCRDGAGCKSKGTCKFWHPGDPSNSKPGSGTSTPGGKAKGKGESKSGNITPKTKEWMKGHPCFEMKNTGKCARGDGCNFSHDKTILSMICISDDGPKGILKATKRMKKLDFNPVIDIEERELED